MMQVALKQMRSRRGLTQWELCRRSGVPQAMISQIESQNVKYPTIITLYKLSKALRCTVDDLIEEDESD